MHCFRFLLRLMGGHAQGGNQLPSSASGTELAGGASLVPARAALAAAVSSSSGGSHQTTSVELSPGRAGGGTGVQYLAQGGADQEPRSVVWPHGVGGQFMHAALSDADQDQRTDVAAHAAQSGSSNIPGRQENGRQSSYSFDAAALVAAGAAAVAASASGSQLPPAGFLATAAAARRGTISPPTPTPSFSPVSSPKNRGRPASGSAGSEREMASYNVPEGFNIADLNGKWTCASRINYASLLELNNVPEAFWERVVKADEIWIFEFYTSGAFRMQHNIPMTHMEKNFRVYLDGEWKIDCPYTAPSAGATGRAVASSHISSSGASAGSAAGTMQQIADEAQRSSTETGAVERSIDEQEPEDEQMGEDPDVHEPTAHQAIVVGHVTGTTTRDGLDGRAVAVAPSPAARNAATTTRCNVAAGPIQLNNQPNLTQTLEHHPSGSTTDHRDREASSPPFSSSHEPQSTSLPASPGFDRLSSDDRRVGAWRNFWDPIPTDDWPHDEDWPAPTDVSWRTEVQQRNGEMMRIWRALLEDGSMAMKVYILEPPADFEHQIQMPVAACASQSESELDDMDHQDGNHLNLLGATPPADSDDAANEEDRHLSNLTRRVASWNLDGFEKAPDEQEERIRAGPIWSRFVRMDTQARPS
ncbi:unnamed protein product [Amoebophrya sp. A25]|nr:unnamed protein product [Amoebophrya sp. A25]|eukprot:GSA25T00001100001.1